ncbi:MAG: hypothetical protein KatS3mg115_2242 [Candidatus Poribacteria bacterium]|nr:MAG: hypothetical protein KatS3mg115_2242 [Candidatus Poribacteria bacterium]
METLYVTAIDFPTDSPWQLLEALWAEIVHWAGAECAAREVQVDSSRWLNLEGESLQEAPAEGFLIRGLRERLEREPQQEIRDLQFQCPDLRDSTLRWTFDWTLFSSQEATHLILEVRIGGYVHSVEPVGYVFHTPEVLWRLIQEHNGHYGGLSIRSTPEPIGSGRAVLKLVQELLHPERRFPIVLISQTAGEYPGRFLVSPEMLGRRLAGLARVVAIDRYATFHLTDELRHRGDQEGRFGCFDGAVRVYWPRLSFEDHPSRHRLYRGEEVGSGFAETVQRVLTRSAVIRWTEPPALLELRRAIRGQGRAETIQRIRSRPPDEEGLLTELEEAWNELEQLREECRRLREENAELRTENANLRSNLSLLFREGEETPTTDLLSSIGEEEGNSSTPASTSEFKTVLEAVQAAQKQTRHLVYLDSAIQSAKDCPYRSPERVYQALLTIDRVAQEWLGSLEGISTGTNRPKRFQELGWDYSEHISQTARTRYGEHYTFRYRDKPILFEAHITEGVGNANECFSIHMHWDNKDRKVAIGYIGRHLPNTLS